MIIYITELVLARKFVLEALTEEASYGRLGLMLQSILSSESVVSPTRVLVYWSIEQPSTMKNWQALTRSQALYFTDTMASPPANDGGRWSSHQLAGLVAWWVRQVYPTRTDS